MCISDITIIGVVAAAEVNILFDYVMRSSRRLDKRCRWQQLLLLIFCLLSKFFFIYIISFLLYRFVCVIYVKYIDISYTQFSTF